MINTNLLSAMANNAAGLAQNPAVAGAGIAAVTAGGIYKIIKDARQSNESLINTFNTPTKLKNPYSNIIKISTDIPRLTATLLAKLVVTSERSLEHTMEYGESKKDTRSLGAKILHQVGYEKNPIGQVLNWIATGQTPSAVNKVFGFDKKSLRKEEHDTKDRAELIGTSTNMARLLGQTAQQIVAGPGTYESKMFKLTLAQTDLLNFIGKGVTTIWKSSGTRNLIALGETPNQDDSWLGKLARLPKTILNLPGINAAKNLVKGATSIVTAPFRMYAKLGIAMDKIRDEVQDFRTGGLFKAQNEADLAKKAGYKVQDFKTFGLPNVLSGITHVLNVIASRAGTQVTLLSTIANVKADTTQTDALIKEGPKVWDQYSGRYVTKKQLGNSKKEMIRRAYNQSFLGSTKSIIHGTIDRARGRTSDESYQRELDRTQQVYGDAIGINSRLTDSGQTNWLGAKQRTWYGAKQKLTAAQITQRQNLLDNQMEDPQARLGGLEETQEIFGERRRNITGSTGYQRSGALTGSIASMTEFGLGLTSLIPGLTILSTVLGGLGILNSGRIGGRTDERFRSQGINTLHGRILSEGDNQFNDLTNLSTGSGSGTGTFIPSIRVQYVPPAGLVSPLTLTPYGAFTPDITPDSQLIFTGLRALEYQAVRLFDLMNTTISSALIEIKTSINDMYTDIGGVMDSNILIQEMKDILKNTSTGTESIQTISRILHKFWYDFVTKFSLPTPLSKGGIVPGNPSPVDSFPALLSPGEMVIPFDKTDTLEKMHAVLIDIRDNTVSNKTDIITSQQTTTANIVEELKAQVVPEGEQRQTEIVEKTRWEKLISATQETKDALKGKISYYLRDAWEKSKFGKKRNGADTNNSDSSSTSSLTSGFMGGLGGLILGKLGLTAMGGIFGGGSKLIKTIAGSIGGLVSTVFGSVFGSTGIIGRMFAGGRIASFFGGVGGIFKFMGRVLKKAFLPLTLLFMGKDIFSSWNDASKISGSDKPSFFQKLGAGMSGLMSNLTFGLVDPKTIYSFFSPVGDWVGGKIRELGSWFKTTKAGSNFDKWKIKDTFKSGMDGNVERITGSSKPNLIQRFGAFASGILSSATLGMVTPDTIYNFMDDGITSTKEKIGELKDWFLNTKAGQNFSNWKMIDTFTGFTDAKVNEIVGTNGGKPISFMQRVGSFFANIFSSATGGMIPATEFYKPMAELGTWAYDSMQNLFNFENKPVSSLGYVYRKHNIGEWDKITGNSKNPLNRLIAEVGIGLENRTRGSISAEDFYGKTGEVGDAWLDGAKMMINQGPLGMIANALGLEGNLTDWGKKNDENIKKVYEEYIKNKTQQITDKSNESIFPKWISNLFSISEAGAADIPTEWTPKVPTQKYETNLNNKTDLEKENSLFTDNGSWWTDKFSNVKKWFSGSNEAQASTLTPEVVRQNIPKQDNLVIPNSKIENVTPSVKTENTSITLSQNKAVTHVSTLLEYLQKRSNNKSLMLNSPDDEFIKNLLQKHEGYRPTPYKDGNGEKAGYSVGIGHFLGKGDLAPGNNRTFSHEEINNFFQQDVLKAKKYAASIPGFDNLNKMGQAALVDMSFNMGDGWIDHPKPWTNLKKSLLNSNTEGIINSLTNSKWFEQVGPHRTNDIISMLKIGVKNPSNSTSLSMNENVTDFAQSTATSSLIPSTPSVGDSLKSLLPDWMPKIYQTVKDLFTGSSEDIKKSLGVNTEQENAKSFLSIKKYMDQGMSRDEATRSSQNVEPVATNLVEKMQDKPIKEEQLSEDLVKIKTAQKQEPDNTPISLVNQPPSVGPIKPKRNHSYDLFLDSTIDRLFNSVIVTFTQTSNKSFIFGDSMNMNPIG